MYAHYTCIYIYIYICVMICIYSRLLECVCITSIWRFSLQGLQVLLSYVSVTDHCSINYMVSSTSPYGRFSYCF